MIEDMGTWAGCNPNGPRVCKVGLPWHYLLGVLQGLGETVPRTAARQGLRKCLSAMLWSWVTEHAQAPGRCLERGWLSRGTGATLFFWALGGLG